MNVWMIGRGYPTTSNKMWGSFELEQAKLLARNNYKVSYIALTLSFFARKDPRGLQKFKEGGVNVYTYSHFYFPGKFGIYLEKFEDNCWRFLFDIVENETGSPDIIHVHYPSMISSINEIEKYRGKGTKIYVTEHWSRVLINKLKKHEIARLRYYTKYSNCFVSVGKTLESSVKNLTKVSVPMEIVPNIVSPLFFNVTRKAKENSFVFVTVGRLVSLKQFDVIIRQFLKAFSGNNRVKLKIIGTGPEKKRLEQICIQNKQIEFLGELPLNKVAEEVKNSDVLVSFSKYETFSVPIVEAWACGKPVIVSDTAGAVTYVNEKLGIIVPNNKPEDLLVALKSIYINIEKYDAEAIAKFAFDNFSDKKIYDKLKFIYTNY